MTDEEQLKALAQPTNSLPPGFNPPPGMPTPTAEDFVAANTSHRAGLGASNPAPPPPTLTWISWALAAVGAVCVGGVAYVAYRRYHGENDALATASSDESAASVRTNLPPGSSPS